MAPQNEPEIVDPAKAYEMGHAMNPLKNIPAEIRWGCFCYFVFLLNVLMHFVQIFVLLPSTILL
jgi:hypothetical protein